MIRSLRKQVLAGFYIALLLMAIVLAAPAPTLADTSGGDTGSQYCHWGCCLYISGWCVWHCIVCEDIPSQ